jgi:hypothetical protein
MVSGFANMKQLYEKIADSHNISSSDILFCTLNTHKLDLNKLLGGQIGLNDFIFVHCKGIVKDVEVTKSEDFLGLTITDNGNGFAFIKKVKEGSLIGNIQFVKAGDHIERVNQEDMVGLRHFEVARALKNISLKSTFTMRLVEPLQAGFSHIGPRNNQAANKKNNLKSGKETLRLRNNGQATVEREVDGSTSLAIDKINSLLESYMGINDTDLSTQIWELGHDKLNPHQFAVAIDNSDLETFSFGDDIIFDLWGIITDFRADRLK